MGSGSGARIACSALRRRPALTVLAVSTHGQPCEQTVAMEVVGPDLGTPITPKSLNATLARHLVEMESLDVPETRSGRFAVLICPPDLRTLFVGPSLSRNQTPRRSPDLSGLSGPPADGPAAGSRPADERPRRGVTTGWLLIDAMGSTKYPVASGRRHSNMPSGPMPPTLSVNSGSWPSPDAAAPSARRPYGA